MRTSLWSIARKAKQEKTYRFFNLYTMLNKINLFDCWRNIKKNAAYGVDNVSATDFEQDLEGNIDRVVEDLKKKRYRAKLVRRHYIPKGKKKFRPLGIPAILDKLLQVSVSRILTSIYDGSFLPFSFGYRPGLGVKDAISALRMALVRGKFGYVVEADIKGYFNNINHDWLNRMLELRINDRPFMRLIKKWLKAGILDTDGQVIHPLTGTPQGGIVSPILANVYLHHVLDLWLEHYVKPRCEGMVYACRYADDFVVLFQYQHEAHWFYRELPNRLGKFDLSLSEEKTRVIRFSRFYVNNGERFDFLGFEFRWGVSRFGKATVKLRTSRKKLRQSLANFTSWCKEYRKYSLRITFDKLCSKLRGYYNHYGIRGNSKSLNEFFYWSMRILFKWLNRRSQKRSYNWTGFNALLRDFNVPKPRIPTKPIIQECLFC